MALGERAAAAVLAGQAHRDALAHSEPNARCSAVAQSMPSPASIVSRRWPMIRSSLRWMWSSAGISVIARPISRSRSSGTAVLPRSYSSGARLRPVQAPSSQSALFIL